MRLARDGETPQVGTVLLAGTNHHIRLLKNGTLANNDIWVDLRELVFVPAGTNGYATDRWYTAGGLLEVGGYLGTQGHSVGEWMAQGGTLTFTGKEVVTEKSAQLNVSGGTADVQGGLIRQTWLKGPDSQLYELSKAPGDILYTGFYKGYEDTNQRWGRTDYYYNPLIASKSRYEAGYTVGRDAGKLVIGTSSAVSFAFKIRWKSLVCVTLLLPPAPALKCSVSCLTKVVRSDRKP